MIFGMNVEKVTVCGVCRTTQGVWVLLKRNS